MNDPNICPTHGLRAQLREGVSKKTGKPYKFWSCNGREDDGSFCRWKPPEPKTAEAQFSQSLEVDLARDYQRWKDDIIVRTAICKELIGRGDRWSLEAAQEAFNWVEFIQGKNPLWRKEDS